MPDTDMAPPKTPNAKRGTIHGAAAHDLGKFTIRAAPLHPIIFEFLIDNLAILRRMQQERRAGEDLGRTDDDDALDDENFDVQGEYIKKPTIKAEQFWPMLREKCREAGGEWSDIVDKIWAFGPQRMGSCLLIDARPGRPNSFKRRLAQVKAGEMITEQDTLASAFDNYLETGFQLATFQGPLCAEPVEGMAYFVESVTLDREGIEEEQSMS